MDLLELLMLVVIAGVCASLAEWLVGYSPGSMFLTIIIGVIGAYFGNLVASVLYELVGIQLFAIRVGTVVINLLWSVLGSALILFLLSILRNGRRRRILSRGNST